MTIKAIIWDLDGTLIQFKIDYLRARREAIKVLKKFDAPKKILTIKKSILENALRAREYFTEKQIDAQKIEEIMSEVDKAVIKVEYDAALQAIPMHGIREVLEYVKKQGLEQTVYTLNTRNNAQISLEKADLSEYFDLIVGRDNVKNSKPHPDHLNAIFTQLNVQPEESIVIGDTARDITGALNVGAHSIAILTKISKIGDEESLYKADKVVKEDDLPSKLLESIQSLIALNRSQK
ncbi:MAG: HAD family hydrolase [Promethearchaeota archaeon]|nr:MAG: HAD family hydrolase [Candidatus Lokiarchaeota archaeon]